ncbi:MAG: acyltransferase [Verrucomicrobiales bacterium]|nr:acyltransferase [Verrucomicrobiota bacterium JB025]
MLDKIARKWTLFWLGRSGVRGFGRFAAWVASRGTAPYHQRAGLADRLRRGFTDPFAHVSHPEVVRGNCVYVGAGVVMARVRDGGPIRLADRVRLYGETFIDTGAGGSLSIGENTHIQPGCQIHAHVGNIRIGNDVEIAAGCGLYSYDHGMAPGVPIMKQALVSKGDVVIGDGAWLGYGVTVLHGVTVGPGAVLAAGAVVVKDVPEHAIVAGVPAKVIGSRSDLKDGADAAPEGGAT